MKSVVILFSLFVLQYCNADTEINADKHIDAFIQKLLTRGSTLFDLPILDPYNNAETIMIGDLDIPDYISLRNVFLGYLHSTGLSTFVSHKLSVIQKDFEIDFDFNFGYTGLTVEAGTYSLTGVFTKSAEPLDGHGAIKIDLRDVTIKGNLTIGISPNSDFIFLQDMALNIDVSSNNIMMTGLNDGAITGDVDLKPILPWVENQIVTFVSNIINEHIVTSMDLLDCFYNCYT